MKKIGHGKKVPGHGGGWNEGTERERKIRRGGRGEWGIKHVENAGI